MNLGEQLDDALRHDEELLGDLIDTWQADNELAARVLARIVGNPVLAGSCILTLVNMIKDQQRCENTHEPGNTRVAATP